MHSVVSGVAGANITVVSGFSSHKEDRGGGYREQVEKRHRHYRIRVLRNYLKALIHLHMSVIVGNNTP